MPCVTLAAWSAILLYFYFSGRIHSLLTPSFRPYTLVAGIVLALLAVCFLAFPLNLDACADGELARSFGRKTSGRLLTFFILLAPICAAAAFTTNSYGLSTIMNRGMADSASQLPARPVSMTIAAPAQPPTPYEEPPLPTKDGSQPPASAAPAPAPQVAQQSQPPPPVNDDIPRSKDGNMIVQVVDLLYAAPDPSLRGDFKNQKIEMIGQLMPATTGNANGKRFQLVRMFMVCCAADARPVAVLVESDAKPKGEDMSWVKVVGTVEFPVENGRPIALFKATKVEPTDPPEETMLY
jgi:uncharacterized repeat protein (TIGR03943 family)